MQQTHETLLQTNGTGVTSQPPFGVPDLSITTASTNETDGVAGTIIPTPGDLPLLPNATIGWVIE